MKNVLAVRNGSLESSYRPFSTEAEVPLLSLLSWMGTFSNAVPVSERLESLASRVVVRSMLFVSFNSDRSVLYKEPTKPGEI